MENKNNYALDSELKCDEVFRHYGDVIIHYQDNFVDIFKILYPALGSNGFTERNQSVNFASAYKTVAEANGEHCVIWFEFPFGKSNHYDALIINDTIKEILVIEAKRINKNKKIGEIRDDIKRIMRFPEVLTVDGDSRISNTDDYKIYGVVLADVWDEKSTRENVKSRVKKSFSECSFLLDEFENNMTVRYEIKSFNEYDKIESSSIRDKYSLLTMAWRVK